MSFNLNVKNFGKLSDATINIGRFTVFAGPNNTGKSFTSKLLYSLFDGMNAHHAWLHFKDLVRPLSNTLNSLEIADFEDFGILSRHEIKKMEMIFEDISNDDDLSQTEEALIKLANLIDEMKVFYPRLDEKVREWANSLIQTYPPLGGGLIITPIDRVENYLGTIKSELDSLSGYIKKQNALSFIEEGIVHKIFHNLTENFQVADLSHLLKTPERPSNISIESIGDFELQKNGLSFSISSSGLKQLQEYSRVIYLESPIYWKLKPALEDVKITPRYFHSSDRERLSQVPGYFYDLARALKGGYTGEVEFQEIYEKLVSKISGKITLSETGELYFQEGERNFSLHLAAVGVTNLGMLALLIEKKILDKGTFLFIDEPEAHLHPAWQVIMAETLFELAKAGVNVVIATHSADILKWLEVHVKNNPDDQDLIALNKFPPNGGQTDTQDFEDKVAGIKQELTKPFADLYWRGL